MDVVGGELAVRERFEEETDGFEKVVLWVYDGGFDVPSWAASAIRMRRLAISSSAIALRS